MSRLVDARTAYRNWSHTYDSDQNRTRDLDEKIMRETALPLAGAHVVELGAGTGKNTGLLAGAAERVTAMDLSPEMLAVATRRVNARNVIWLEHDITQAWPLNTNAADLVVGNLVLEHIADLSPVFRETARVIKPGGLMHISELHPIRQLKGRQAYFRTKEGPHFVEAYLHLVSDYLDAARAVGFELKDLGEHIEGRDRPDMEHPPRILTVTFRRSV